MLSELETKLLGVMMMVIMLGMGASLTFKDFAIALRKPQGLIVGLLCQYGLMPAIAYFLGQAVGLPPAYAIGLILMGCMPGGTTSNIFTYFSKGTLSLSILMTISSTLVAIVMVPLTLAFYSQGIEGDWKIPPGNVIQVLFVLLVPTLLGIVLRKWNANVGAVIEMIGGLLGVLVILFLMGSWVPRNFQLLLDTGFPVYAASIGLGLLGFVLGFGLSRLLRQDPQRSRTIALETGIQNGPLAVLIVTLTFTGTQQQDVLLIPVLYSFFIVLTSSMVTIWFRGITRREELARDQSKIGALSKA
ncbi:MAG: bile acid:sodium symporter family protein [Roseateles asaccharophilus]|uniref:BASS family bile acid:Na+ symporter n=1 Tax=Roseateles asaccharophilus TaxID=582607 RepID=A0A4R6NA59_9BURK|nr:bile acid:sodium symporter family protein [Roseateles asaccharophilus]MDN3544831.1 bile acid:sodium symporter family protein [Roseateles asaccharophilus]TDP12783.1 BASS family bile acid:Na+ symporter [Roseateles asaccharophilus]